jgi:hypothetical protein
VPATCNRRWPLFVGLDRHATAPGARGDPSDDVEVPDSFRVVRGSTGNSDLSDRDFCADLVEFTS